jgi:hypothetical protein
MSQRPDERKRGGRPPSENPRKRVHNVKSTDDEAAIIDAGAALDTSLEEYPKGQVPPRTWLRELGVRRGRELLKAAGKPVPGEES